MPNKLGMGLALLVALTVSAGAQAPQTPASTSETHTATTPGSTSSTPDLVPAHPATVEQIHEYYKVTHAIETAHELMSQMVSGMQSTSVPYLPKAFWDDMRSSMMNLDLEAALIPAYQRYFSEEDMASVIAFYKSPAGQRLLEAQPLIESAAGDQLRKAGQEIGHAVYLRHKDEIEAAKKTYDAAQAASAATDPKK